MQPRQLKQLGKRGNWKPERMTGKEFNDSLGFWTGEPRTVKKTFDGARMMTKELQK